MTPDHIAELDLIETSRAQRNALTALFAAPEPEPSSGFHPDDIAHTMRFWACDRDEAIRQLQREWIDFLADEAMTEAVA